MKRRRRRVESEEKAPLYHSVMAVSSRALTVCGCKRIEAYSQNEVRLLLREMRLEVTGEGLTLTTGCGERLEIRGLIRTLAFDESGAGR